MLCLPWKVITGRRLRHVLLPIVWLRADYLQHQNVHQSNQKNEDYNEKTTAGCIILNDNWSDPPTLAILLCAGPHTLLGRIHILRPLQVNLFALRMIHKLSPCWSAAHPLRSVADTRDPTMMFLTMMMNIWKVVFFFSRTTAPLFYELQEEETLKKCWNIWKMGQTLTLVMR